MRGMTASITPATGANPVAGATHTPPISTEAGTRVAGGMLFSRGLSQFFFMETFFISRPDNKGLRRRRPLFETKPVYLDAEVLAPSALPVSDLAYLRRKRSTRPAVSTSFCLPVKNGWQAEQISRLMAPLWVDRVTNAFPHAQCTFVSSYLGWIAGFIASDTFRGKPLFYLKLACFG